MITYLIRTNSLEADERFVKTLAFLAKSGKSTRVFGIVKSLSRGANDYVERQLGLRKLFPSGQLMALKYAEVLARTLLFMLCIRGRRWFANFDFLPLHLGSALLTSKDNRPIWDLHEMPPSFFVRNPLARRLFAFLLRRSSVIVCNDARRAALEEIFGVDLSDALVLRNFPSKSSFQAIADARREYLVNESLERDVLTIVIVGGNMPGRYVSESIAVIDELRQELQLDIRVKLVGGAPLDDAPSFVSSTGFIPFDRLVKECVAGGVSLCFYRRNSLNNILCEPNRFYQAVAAGQQVLTFDHPSLRPEVYDRHTIVDEGLFEESLKAKLIDATKPSGAGRDGRLPTTAEQPIFDKQFSDFSAWI